jgi:hypothetical protein
VTARTSWPKLPRRPRTHRSVRWSLVGGIAILAGSLRKTDHAIN